MTDTRRISAWIETLPDSFNCPPWQAKTTNKRKALQEPSPPATVLDMDQTPTRKRLRRPDPATDPDLTPQARPHNESAPSRSPSRVSSVSGSSASSYRPRSSSPLKKQIMGLRLDETGLEIRELKIEAAPNLEAGLLLSTLDEIGSSLEFLPDNRRDEILGSSMLQGLDPRPWRYSFKSSSEFENLPGRIPSPQEVALVYEWAKDCRQLGHEEAGWNAEVHHRLMEAIFREPGRTKGGLFNFATCTTARPHRNWLPRSIGSKMVDFCLYADLPQEDPQSLQALEALCRRTLTLTVNHTDFERLQLRPIVLSIETKGPAPALNTAEVQMGVWHAAQWGFIRSAVLSSLREPSDTVPTKEQEKQADEALSRLPFIPGVIVQGHR
ncbi:hypothetical protein BGZ61DRAFT_405238 [Ilyonectria robusta]|uniref:uncharacterized protein n=1 Tax=Ilyonectria robusta TaxID=1079257 RepID=UPI001E8EB3D3|nr:uncharacterized protein BGZ61DRAFT_405238 [Ilyonectria robusta]KAH8654771.1 hypothetical protein BGZ61DRAFT_405238 [Ilyonectria robusta]